MATAQSLTLENNFLAVGREKEAPKTTLRDESKGVPSLQLEPLRQVVFSWKDLQSGKVTQHDVTPTIAKDLRYIDITQAPEVNTTRTQGFEVLLQKMLEGETYDGPVRIIILNRGEESRAYVYPDGTICISQSLINKMETLDRVMAIVAHELGHLIHSTAERRFSVSYFGSGSRGLSWVHEYLAADMESPRLLAKIGLRSTALAEAFQILAAETGNERSDVHQALLARAMEIMAQHAVIHHDSSHVPSTSLPEEYIRNVSPTNLETAQKLRSNKPQELVEVFPLLCAEDLDTVLYKLEFEEKLKYFVPYVRAQLKAKGFDDQEIRIYLIARFLSAEAEEPKDPAEWLQLYKTSIKLVQEGQLPAMDRIVLKREWKADMSVQNDLWRMFLQICREQYIPQEIVLEAITDTVKFVGTENSLHKDLLAQQIEIYFLREYLQRYYFQAERPEEFASAHLRMLFTKLNVFGRPPRLFSRDFLKDPQYLKHREAINAAYYDVFGVPFEPPAQVIEKQTLRFEDIGPEILAAVNLSRNKRELSDQVRKILRDFESTIRDLPPDQREKYMSALVVMLLQVPLEKFSPDKQQQEMLRFSLVEDFLHTTYLYDDKEENYLRDLRKYMEISDLDVKELSFEATLQLLWPVIFAINKPAEHTKEGFHLAQIADIDAVLVLPYFQELERKAPHSHGRTFTELLGEVQQLQKELDYIRFHEVKFFSEDVVSLLCFGSLRSTFEALLQQPLEPEQIPALVQLIQAYLPDSLEMREVVRNLQLQYLQTTTLPLPQRVEYFGDHHRTLGSEGLKILADQTATREEFLLLRIRVQSLREEYLTGKKNAGDLATADFLASFFREPRRVVDTVKNDQDYSEKESTQLAFDWILTFFEDRHRGDRIVCQYDPQTQMFVVSEFGEKIFISLHDVLHELHTMSEQKRLYLMFRLLGDKNGLLTNPEDRRFLAERILETFGVADPFTTLLVTGAVREGDPQILGFPVAQMLAPLLFRGLREQSIEYRKLLNKGMEDSKKKTLLERLTESSPTLKDAKILPPLPRLQQILTSPTSDISAWSSSFRFSPKPNRLTTTAASVHTQADRCLQLLAKLSGTDQARSGEIQETGQDSIEGIISALETAGALFIRALQMATQLKDFGPKINRRLAQTLDRVEGQDKFTFWTNLLNLAEKDQDVSGFMEKRFISLGEYLGGGSLFTTYAALVKDDEGKPVRAVIKMLNPNAEEFINQGYKLSKTALEFARQHADHSTRSDLALAEELLDLAYEWCLADINQEDYLEEDERLRAVVSAFNKEKGRPAVVAPQSFFKHPRLNCEHRYEGETLNLLAEEEAPEMQELVRNYLDFFDFQFRQMEELGTEEAIFHSDPHLGNYMAQRGVGKELGMIDRNLPLVFPRDLVDTFRLLYEGKYSAFLGQLLRKLFDLHQVPPGQRRMIITRLTAALSQEALHQTVRLNRDPLPYTRKIFTVLASEGLKVPYQWRLMIRNCMYTRVLRERYKIEDRRRS